jgi:xylulokinase
VNVTHGAAYGAALLAGVGASVHPSVPEACRAIVHETSETRPSDDRVAYERAYAVYRSLYPTLADTFRAQTALVQGREPAPTRGDRTT